MRTIGLEAFYVKARPKPWPIWRLSPWKNLSAEHGNRPSFRGREELVPRWPLPAQRGGFTRWRHPEVVFDTGQPLSRVTSDQ